MRLTITCDDDESTGELLDTLYALGLAVDLIVEPGGAGMRSITAQVQPSSAVGDAR